MIPGKPVDECVWCCGKHEDACGSESHRNDAGKVYFCTRRKGHDGVHMACGVMEHELSAWVSDAEKGGE